MNVLFIYPDVLLHRLDWTGYFYTGIASLSATLKAVGHDTSLIHITKPTHRAEFVEDVRKAAPDLIGFSSTSPMFPLVRQYAAWIREAGMEVTTVCGGIHPTIAPEESIEAKGIDIICRGEGEGAMVDLVRCLESGQDFWDIQNLWIKNNGDIVKNPLRPRIENLDELPFPDRSIFNFQNLYSERTGKGTFMVSRGCPFNCTYCCNHVIRGVYGRGTVTTRFRSVDNVIAEIETVIGEYPFIKMLDFDDDILFLKRNWAKEFAIKYASRIRLPFVCNARANLIDREIVELLAEAGCRHIKLGVESGNEFISEVVLKRGQSNEEIRNAFALCKEAGLTTESFNMVGIPGDTPATILDTIKLNADIGTDRMQVSICQPFRGTKLADHALVQGFYEPGDLELDWFSPVLRLKTVSESQVQMFRDYFILLVWLYRTLGRIPGGGRFLIVASDRILSAKITAKVLNLAYIPMNHVYRRILLWKFALLGVRRKLSGRIRMVSPKRNRLREG
jgi:radical SAM superfamily enzyme YgiQ (UPF0313 family)